VTRRTVNAMSTDDDRTERLDDDDRAVLCQLGYALARGQLFEIAMLKLVEAQRHDLSLPLDDRWVEIEKWLTKWTAGHAADELRVPNEIAADLHAIVGGRNHVVHRAWWLYIGRRAKVGDRAVAEYTEWLVEQARLMGRAYNGVMTILGRLREDADPPDDAALIALWRTCVPDKVEDVLLPEQTAG
jgi:hypothetical protein